MADLGFFDGLILGSILLGAVFVIGFVGFFIMPFFWVAPLLGLPVIVGIVVVYEFLRRSSRSEVMQGVAPRILGEPRAKYCPACGTSVGVEASDCPRCARKLLPTYDVRTPLPTYCLVCGTLLEPPSRYRRGWCPRCGGFR